MKKMIASVVTLMLALILAACASDDNTDNKINIPNTANDLKSADSKDEMTEKVPKTTETHEVMESSEVSSDRTVSGFDVKTNNTITWSGVRFSIPSYFDVLDKGSSETWMHYYPEEEDYYASLVFESLELFLETQEDFNSQISSVVKSILESEDFSNKEIQKSEKISIAGLPGWTIIYSESDKDGEISTGIESFVYNINNGKLISFSLRYDSKDKSQYDYLGDYQKVLQAAKLINVEKLEEEILTIENNKELATMIRTKDETSPLFKEFAQKYAGRTIEFDGHTAYVSNHGNNKTRFDYLIYAGDYSETTFSGPSFQFRDVNYYDLHLTGDNVPDTFGLGLNIRIIATVEEFDENSGLFQLEPVSIKIR